MKNRKKFTPHEDYDDYSQDHKHKKLKGKLDRKMARRIKQEESEYEEEMLSRGFDDLD